MDKTIDQIARRRGGRRKIKKRKYRRKTRKKIKKGRNQIEADQEGGNQIKDGDQKKKDLVKEIHEVVMPVVMYG